MKPGRATTLQDVARESGVTAMTVSVVLNGSRSATRVSEATRRRIVEAASRLRYRPNAVARGLARRRMDAIGVVAIVDSSDVNLYFLEVLNGIVHAAAEHDQNTTIFAIADWSQDQRRILQFCDGRVDGMILLGPSPLPSEFADYLQQHTPVVAIHGDELPPSIDVVEVDNEGGAHAMTMHLISLGHRRIAYLAGCIDMIAAQQRLVGYRRALNEARIPHDESLVFPGSFVASSGRESVDAILSGGLIDPLPTAIFCADDAIATGAIEALAKVGLRVPADISVAGFDDLLLARMTNPPLTTVRQPFREMGTYAVERLLQRIKEVNAPEAGDKGMAAEDDPHSGIAQAAAPAPHTEVFPVSIVERDSVGPPPRIQLHPYDYR